jgi:hypothetical protein
MPNVEADFARLCVCNRLVGVGQPRQVAVEGYAAAKHPKLVNESRSTKPCLSTGSAPPSQSKGGDR